MHYKKSKSCRRKSRNTIGRIDIPLISTSGVEGSLKSACTFSRSPSAQAFHRADTILTQMDEDQEEYSDDFCKENTERVDLKRVLEYVPQERER